MTMPVSRKLGEAEKTLLQAPSGMFVIVCTTADNPLSDT